MATGWVKSLHCKSRSSTDDVYTPNPKPHLLPIPSCSKSLQGVKDVITQTPPPSKPKPKPKSAEIPRHRNPMPCSARVKRSQFPSEKPFKGPDADPYIPALTELPEGHASRNVVEIIFRSRWGPKSFPGRVQMVFKIHNMPRTFARFEGYREAVKRRADSSGLGNGCVAVARCAADGNEMMRFHCVGRPSGAVAGKDDCGGGIWAVAGGKGSARVSTFAASGRAHDSAGGGRGTRAMLICRVIAGRVRRKGDDGIWVGSMMRDDRVEFDSVGGEDGELMVLDSGAVLPCFLIIYKL